MTITSSPFSSGASTRTNNAGPGCTWLRHTGTSTTAPSRVAAHQQRARVGSARKGSSPVRKPVFRRVVTCLAIACLDHRPNRSIDQPGPEDVTFWGTTNPPYGGSLPHLVGLA